jgi:hypothetical protein
MPRYHVHWCKTYYASGNYEIDADSPEEADRIAFETLGDQEGSIQYNPDDDYVEVMEIAPDTWENLH